MQYFATGDAASYLATKPEVRIAMINRLDPSANVSLSFGAIAILDSMVEQFVELSESDTYIKAILDKVKKKTYPMSTGFNLSGIKAYQSIVPKSNVVKEVSSPLNMNNDFKALYDYVAIIEDHINITSENLDILVKASEDNVKKPIYAYEDVAGNTIWSKHPSESDIKSFEDNLVKMQAEYVKHYQLLAKDEDVKSLFEYYISKVSTGG